MNETGVNYVQDMNGLLSLFICDWQMEIHKTNYNDALKPFSFPCVLLILCIYVWK